MAAILTQTHGCFRASWAVMRLAGLMVSIWLMRFLASGVTVSHSGDGNYGREMWRWGRCRCPGAAGEGLAMSSSPLRPRCPPTFFHAKAQPAVLFGHSSGLLFWWWIQGAEREMKRILLAPP